METAEAMTENRPNVIFILSDDISWADMGCFGQDKILTPHLDALAESGMIFSSCYAGAPVCAPSRSCLMQGKHMGHATVRENMVSPFDNVTYRHCLQADDTTLAHKFREAGYATGMFGKWGLALQGQTGLPNEMGFDRFFGYLNQRKAHNYYPPYLWSDNRRIDLPENKGHNHRKPNEYDSSGRCLVNGVKDPHAASYSFDLCERESLEFVRQNADTPFFLYLPVTIPHQALEVPSLGEYNGMDWPIEHKIYAAMISRLDASVGRLVDLLKELDCYDNTLIVFAGDNGYSHSNTGSGDISLDEFFRHSGPFKGSKGNLHQGGVRAPAFVHWPGVTPAGSACNTPWGFFDIMPTFCELLGVSPPENIDGVSVLPTFTGRTDKQQPRDFMYWEFGDEQAARINSFWAYRAAPSRNIEVYHADADPGQERDLAGERVDIAEQARTLFATEHEATPYFRSPGETVQSWRLRIEKAGIHMPDNVND